MARAAEATIRITIPGEVADPLRVLVSRKGYTSMTHFVTVQIARYLEGLKDGELEEIFAEAARQAQRFAKSELRGVLDPELRR